MEHGREEVRMQRRVPETLFQLVSTSICALRVDLGSVELLGCRNIIPEGRIKRTVDVDLEYSNEQDWR
jgi:hypothetical protein